MDRILAPDEVREYPWGMEPHEDTIGGAPSLYYVEVDACCPACSDAREDLPGHFVCSGRADFLVARGAVEIARCLDGGWRALLVVSPIMMTAIKERWPEVA